MHAADWGPFTAAVEELSDTQFYLDDTPLLTPARLRTKCRRLALEHGLDLVLIDYLQLMSGGSRFDSRTQEVSYISRQLKLLARELKVPVLAAAQLSRAVEQRLDKKPVLSDLRESGAIEQDADVIMFLSRSEDAPNLVNLEIAKHRNGPTAMIDLIFDKTHTNFENVQSSRSTS